jgi:hypothetical protein
MNPQKQITPLDKEALALMPGLRYARSLIDIAMHVARNSALRENLKPPSSDSTPPTKN